MRGGSCSTQPVEVGVAGGGGREGVWRRRRPEDDEDDPGYQVEGDESGEDEGEGQDGGQREAPGKGGGRCWIVLVVLFVFQLTLPSIMWSYGILLSRMVENEDITLSAAIWTPALFSATLCLADPWSRWPVIKGSLGRRRKVIATWMLRPMSVAGIFLASGSLAVTPFLTSRHLYMITYGILAGLGTSLAVTQSELFLDHHFPPRRKRRRRRVLCLASIRVGCSLSQFIAPLLLLAVVDIYGRRYAPLMYSGFILQAMVAAVLLSYRNKESSSRRNVRMRSMRYSIMEEEDGLDSDTGWHLETRAATEGENLLPFEEDLAGRSWKNPAKDDATAYDMKDDDEDIYSDEQIGSENADTIPSLLQLPRRKNCYGVEILPEIPEETEEDDSGDGKQSKRSSRRLTISISNNNNNNNNGKDSSIMHSPLTSVSNFPNGNYLPDTPSSTSSTTFLISPNNGLRKWKRWKWRRRRKWRNRSRKNSEREDCEEEEDDEDKAEKVDETSRCYKSVREVVDLSGLCKASFYPALALSASSKLASMAFFSLVPYVARRLGKTQNDATLLVSLAGFSSLLVSVSTPWISLPSPKAKVAGLLAPRSCKKFLYSIGSLTSSFSFFLLSRCDWYDRLTLASILFGIGNGATADTSGSLLRIAYGNSDAVGPARGLMSTLTAFFILGFTALMGSYADAFGMRVPTSQTIGSLSVCFSIVAILQFMAGIMWLIQPILSRFYRRQRHYADWNPGMFLHAA